MSSKRILLLSFVLALFAAPPMFATCTAAGWVVIGPDAGYYDHIADGQPPTGTTCWTISGAAILTDSYCGSTQHAFDFDYGDSVSQTIVVPSNMTATHWDLAYQLTMVDPHDDGYWDRLKARVYDVTTSTTIASQTYWGDDPDLNCGRRDLTFTGNYAGHTLKVIFEGSKGYGDTYVRVRGISLYQY